MRVLTYLFALGLMVWSCGGQTGSEEGGQEGESAEEITPVTELSYQEIVDLVYVNDSGEAVEWHGEGGTLEAIENLSIAERGTCGDGDCGQQLYLTNNSEQPVETIIYAPYSLEGQDSYTARKYTIAPEEELPIGCSHMCYAGKSFTFDRQIVSASFVVEEESEQ